jgi:hypothetical protein
VDKPRYYNNLGQFQNIKTLITHHFFHIRSYNITKRTIHYYIASIPKGHGKEKLEQTGKKYKIDNISFSARKKTNNKWYETQDQIGYWEDFSKQKIIYPNMTKYLPFVLDNSKYVTNQKCFILSGEHCSFLCAFLNSSLFKYCYRDNFPELQGGTRELSKVYFEKLHVKKVNDIINTQINELVLEIQSKRVMSQNTKNIEKQIDEIIFDLYSLTTDEKETIGFIEIM